MEQLSRDLQSDPRNAAEVRVVRFEDFARPAAVCGNVFRFAMGPNATREAARADAGVCQRYLSSPAHGRALRLAGSSVSPDKHGVEFSPAYFDRSTHRRIQQFRDAFARLPPALRQQVMAVNARLERFGYSLRPGIEYLYRGRATSSGAPPDAHLFAPWELKRAR